jgi:hypothetical protein
MIDRMVMVTMLNALKSVRDVSGGTEENQVFNMINLESVQTIAPSLIREHLQTAKDNGWVEPSVGLLKTLKWRITPAGVGALSDLMHGG